MTWQESENVHIPEATNLITVDPSELMRDNPAALIVNNESYGRMEAHFSPIQLDPPQVVRVRTFSSEHGEVGKLFVIDGMTRTKFASDHKGTTLPDYPGFLFDAITVRDVTSSMLRNPMIVPQEEKQVRQKDITMLQYLRAVIPPTVEHSAIAPDRIAAHLINGWENMVGEELSEHFSALAALNLLRNPEVPIATDRSFKRFIEGQPQIVASETGEERERLQQGLVEMATIIRQSKLIKEHVAQSAFELVSAQSPVIGGERQARQQIYGMLYTPSVDRRLTEAFPIVSDREQARMQLGEHIAETFSRFASREDQGQQSSIVGDVLRDPYLDFSQILDILSFPTPSTRYVEVKQEANVNRLTVAYSVAQTRGSRQYEVTEQESQMIRQFGNKTYLPENDLPSLLKTIKNADNALRAASKIKERLIREHDELLAKGVSERVIGESLTQLDKVSTSLLASTVPSIVLGRIKELSGVVANVDARITRQIVQHQAGEVIEDMFGDSLRGQNGEQLRTGMIVYVIREVSKPDTELIRSTLGSLQDLDNDLQYQVVSGDMRITRAIQAQKRRTDGVRQRHIGVQVKPIITEPIEQPTEPVIITRSPAEHIVGEEVLFVDSKTIEERRKNRNNERLREGITVFSQRLSNLDLEANEVDPSSQVAIDSILKQLGHLRFDHPDLVRAFREYEDLQKKEIRRMEAQVQQNVEDAQKEARTKI